GKAGTMSETTSGLVRLATLFLLSAALSWIWVEDRQVQGEFALARAEAAENARKAQNLTEHSPKYRAAAAVREASAVKQGQHAVRQPSAVAVHRVEVEMVLPEGIAPGRY